MHGFQRNRRVSQQRRMGLAGAGAALAWGSAAASSQAGVILSPTGVESNSLGDYSPTGGIGNVIGQSGLSSGFTSGTTNYAAYLLTSPTHLAADKGGSAWNSASGNTTGSIVFDLGDTFSIERLAIWQGGGTGPVSSPAYDRNINGITLETSPDLAFTSPFAAGSFNVPEDASPYSVHDFDLTDSVGRYVRLNITSNHGHANLSRFGEIAFDVQVVPEPSSILLLTAAGIALIVRRFCQRKSKV